MGINERVDNYYGKMQDIFQRMGNHQIPVEFFMSIFIGGLYPMELRTYVKEGAIVTYAQAYAKAENLGGMWKINWSYTLTIFFPIIQFPHTQEPFPSLRITIIMLLTHRTCKTLMHHCISNLQSTRLFNRTQRVINMIML